MRDKQYIENKKIIMNDKEYIKKYLTLCDIKPSDIKNKTGGYFNYKKKYLKYKNKYLKLKEKIGGIKNITNAMGDNNIYDIFSRFKLVLEYFENNKHETKFTEQNLLNVHYLDEYLELNKEFFLTTHIYEERKKTNKCNTVYITNNHNHNNTSRSELISTLPDEDQMKFKCINTRFKFFDKKKEDKKYFFGNNFFNNKTTPLIEMIYGDSNSNVSQLFIILDFDLDKKYIILNNDISKENYKLSESFEIKLGREILQYYLSNEIILHEKLLVNIYILNEESKLIKEYTNKKEQ